MYNIFVRIKKDYLILFGIILLAAFFRFYKFRELQYWSIDEELLTATIRHIIWDKSPSLLVQNVAVAFGLGPFYHYFLTPFFFLSRFNLVLLQAIASVLGLLTVLFVYWAGELIAGKKFGLISAFVYSCSFLVSLFDRRLSHLTLDPILGAFTFFLLAKIIKSKKYRHAPLLAIPVGFSFHADPSLAVLAIAIFASLILFRLSIPKKYLIWAVVILGIFFLPLIAAEIRYNHAVSHSIIESFARPLRGESVSATIFFYYPPQEFFNVLGRIIFSAPSNFIELNFQYSASHFAPLFTPFVQIAVVLMLLVSFSQIFKKKPFDKNLVKLLWVFVFSFLLGVLVFNIIFKGNIYQHYFTVIFPVLVLIFSQTVFVIYKRNRCLALAILIFYLAVNLITLANSSVKYPLNQKIALVKETLKVVDDKKYSIEASKEPFIQGGGWTELFIQQKKFPVYSFSYSYLDWIYQAYSLYPAPMVKEAAERIVWITNDFDPKPSDLPIISTLNYKDIKVYIFDNPESLR